MSEGSSHPASRPSSFEERYRLYLDESGDHVFKFLPNEKAPRRGFLALAHAGDPTPVIWIAANVTNRSGTAQRISFDLKSA